MKWVKSINKRYDLYRGEDRYFIKNKETQTIVDWVSFKTEEKAIKFVT